MIVTVIKKHTKHNRVFNIGDELGITKDKAIQLIKLGLVEDTDDVLKLKVVKEVVTPKTKKNASKTNKKA